MKRRLYTVAALLALAAIAVHIVLRFVFGVAGSPANAPLVAVLAVCGVPIVADLLGRAVRGEFGSDHLAGVSIVASSLLGEYLAGVIVVLMLAGGNVLEEFADVASGVRAARPGETCADDRASPARLGDRRHPGRSDCRRRRAYRCCLTRSAPWTAR